MNVSYQYNKKAGKSIRLLSFICSECSEESIVTFNGQGKYACTNCGWKIELIKEAVYSGEKLLYMLSRPLTSLKTPKLPNSKINALKTYLKEK